MRYAPVAICLLMLCLATVQAEAFTVVLHARTPGGTGNCTASGLPNCTTSGPRTDIAAGEYFRMYIFLNNYQSVQALQTGMAWPADWIVDPDANGVRNCRTNQLNLHEPTGAGGPTDGSLITGFDCFNGPQVCLTNAIDFQAGATGCLQQINPEQGTHRVEIVDCNQQSTLLDADSQLGHLSLGSICVGGGGFNACPPPNAVEPATWGRIKASYQR